MPVAALLVIPSCFAAAMLFLAVPAGDWLDDSPLLLAGLPALASGLVTFVFCQRRGGGVGIAASWAVGSAIAAAVLFGAFLLVAIGIGCERTGC